MWLEVNEVQKQRPVQSYVFYHHQDTIRAVESGELFLAYGTLEKNEAAEHTITQCIVAVLKETGFAVEWNGSTETHILLKNLDWKKRR